MTKKYKYINKEKLDLVVDYALTLRKSNKVDYTELDEIGKHVFDFMIELYGYNGFPNVVNDKAFSIHPSPLLYRGVKDIEDHAKLLCDFNYHYGYGVSFRSNGIYSSTAESEAKEYTSGNGKLRNKDRIMKFKLEKNALIDKSYRIQNSFYDWQDVKLKGLKRPGMKELISYVSNLGEHKNYIKSLLLEDPGKIAIILGFDAIYSLDGYVILNRSKLVISESEYKRIISQSKYYNLNGTINFEQKYEDDYFLNK